jgi:uncharacterized membrane protein
MLDNLIHVGPSVVTAFFASLVEFIEALTIVLAVGAARGWRSTLAGTAGAVLTLAGVAALAGPALVHIPIDRMRLAIGLLTLLFGMRWLRKAILRAAGVIAQHDEAQAYARQTAKMTLAGEPLAASLDTEAFAAAFQATMIEGLEVVFIVIAVGTTGVDMWLPAAGAAAAFVLVTALGIALHRPLLRVPENTLKFGVAVTLCALGTFWVGEGTGLPWPGGDWSVIGLMVCFLALAAFATPLARRQHARASSGEAS